MRRIRWPDKREARDEWKEAIRSMRSAWESCYQDTGTPVDVEALVRALGREDELEMELAA